jgi:hypothetical protein
VSLIYFHFQVRCNFSPISILFFRLDNNPSLCGNNICNPTQNKKKNKAKLLQIVIPVIAAAAVVLLLVAVFVLVIWPRIKNRPGTIVDNTS